jgi:hypothetical protein
MGQAHENTQVLVIAPETHQISTIISPNAYDLARSERSETATLPKLSPAGSLRTRQIWTGVSAETLHVLRDRMPHDQFLKWIGDSMDARYRGAKLAEDPKVEDDQVNNVFSITAAYDVPGLAMEKDGNWIVRFAPSNLKGALPGSAPNRTSPIIIPGFPFQGLYTFEIKFLDEVTSTIDPRSTTVKAKQFSYTVTSSFRGNVRQNYARRNARDAEQQDWGRATNSLGGGLFLHRPTLQGS